MNKINEKNIRKYALKLLKQDYNCGEVVVRTVANNLKIKLPIVAKKISSAMNGGGRAGAQCGILEAGLLILSLLCGRADSKQPRDPLQILAYKLTKKFENEYGNLLCRNIRPEGFKPDQINNICEERIIYGIIFLLNFFEEISNLEKV
ncbi:MAG: C-GCAxxG-C-C family protein [Candidatus Gracilibacteria bacterium]|jgi:C_GCAxxG_C_C family probable redox protein